MCAWDSLKGFSLLTLVSGGVVCGEPWRGAAHGLHSAGSRPESADSRGTGCKPCGVLVPGSGGAFSRSDPAGRAQHVDSC